MSLEIIDNEFRYVDYYDEYGNMVHFFNNKSTYLHGWYPFVEGYSSQFIKSIIEELDYIPDHCLEPFSGSGTTAVELQKFNIKCSSFEVNPFMYSLGKSKMRTDYLLKSVLNHLNFIKNELANKNYEFSNDMIPLYKSLVNRGVSNKWIFNDEVMQGLNGIKICINKIKDKKYKELFNVVFASMLLELSNVYRNGKSIKYKKKKMEFTEEEVCKLFIQKFETVILPDIQKINQLKKDKGKLFSNHKYSYLGDCKTLISKKIEDKSIDLVITSPPYLNSRDYTDSYMIELWMLDLIKDYDDLKALRGRTFKSHVQYNWGDLDSLKIPELEDSLRQLNYFKDSFWNKNIPNMIKGYFLDINKLFVELSKKMKNNGMVYLNVANSAYYGIEIKVDVIISKIASMHGFEILEIRKARNISPSSQQKEKIPFLLEVVIVMKKNNEY